MNSFPTSTVPAGLLESFTDYLRHERGLAPVTVENYLNQVRPFVEWFAARRSTSLTAVSIADITDFLTWRAQSCSPGSIMVAATGVRALLRWMFAADMAAQDLAPAVGPVHYSAYAGRVRPLSAADLARLLETPMSGRDRAVVLLLTRLALRSREVAELRLDDVDWRSGELMVTGKGNERQVMPLPAEVGEHLAQYLRGERDPSSVYRQVFLTATVPQRPLTRTGISSIVTRVAARAGLAGGVAAHRLRHTAASAVLADGGTLAEAGQLLRHRSMATTSIYAKTAPAALAALVRPWPAMDSTPSAGDLS